MFFFPLEPGSFSAQGRGIKDADNGSLAVGVDGDEVRGCPHFL